MTYTKDNIVFVPKSTHFNFNDLTNQPFGRLTVLGYGGRGRGHYGLWWCECVCGNITKVADSSLHSGDTQSCGCLAREVNSLLHRKHGETVNGALSVEIQAYYRAKNRCQNPTNAAYANYGGRGIEFRLTSIQEMLDDIGRRPVNKNSIDRIDTNGHYEIGNIQWANAKEQAQNRRGVIWITIDNVTKCAAEWASVSPVKATVIRKRIHMTWCDTCAVMNPPKQSCPHR